MYEQANQQVTDDTSKGLNRAWNELQYRVKNFFNLKFLGCYAYLWQANRLSSIYHHHNIMWPIDPFRQLR